MIEEPQLQPRGTYHESNARILIASKDAELRQRLASDLVEAGLWVVAISTEAAVLEEVERGSPDLLVVDWRDGIRSLLSAVRTGSDVPIVVLVRIGDADGAKAAFDGGADDSVAWPCDPGEFARRIEAILRRSRRDAKSNDALSGPEGLSLRPRAHEVYVGDSPVELTPKEFLVLQLLLEHRGEVLTADRISASLWGHETFGARNFVEAHVSRLRSKLGAAGANEVITTIRGVGYKVR